MKYLLLLLSLCLLTAAPGAQQTVNIGSTADDGTGDGPRASFTKINANFDEIYDLPWFPLTPGDLATLDTVATGQITDGTILNSDIDAAAAIDLSKLATNPLARANHTGTQAFSTLTGTPTTLAGYGIADSMTAAAAAAAFQAIEATLADIADGTIAENLVNTANPWADNEVADNITVTGSVAAGTVVASGFNGQLATTDDTMQEIAQKVDDLALGATDFDALTAATEADIDADDVFAVSHDGTEKKITLENLVDLLEAQTFAFSAIDVTTLDADVFQIGGVTVTPTAAELNFSDGVTSGIQAQLDAKAPLAGPVFTGNITVGSTAGTATLTSGQVNLNTTDNQIGVHNGTKEVAIPLTTKFSISFDPKAVCDGAVDRLFLFPVTAPKGITIVRWSLSYEADPTTEVDMDLKRADAFIGVANSAVMDVLDTTAGVSSETTASNINAGAVVATGKVLYLEFGTAYTETTHQMIFSMDYEIEED